MGAILAGVFGCLGCDGHRVGKYGIDDQVASGQ